MRTLPIAMPPRWAVPVALCAVLTVGCSTVGGSSADDRATPPSSISVAAPVASDTEPAVIVSDTPSASAESTPAETTPAETTPAETDSGPSNTPAPSTTGPGGGPSVTSEVADPPSTPAPRTLTGKLLNLATFQSPSGNIGCRIEEGLSVRCDLGASDIKEKHDCGDGGDWGQAMGLDRGRKAAMLCASDTVTDPYSPILAYGSSARVGSITCTSSQQGMACGDDLGHGFRLSRSSYEVH